jgi:DNA-binding NarL/FixJ family response regulator
MIDGKVVATLHADAHFRRRRVDVFDRDSVAAFATGLGYALERAALVDRVDSLRGRVRRFAEEAEQATAASAGADWLNGHRPVPATLPPMGERRPTGLRLPAETLTPRERQVLDLVATGATNAEIARELVIEPGTANAHVKKILRKLGVTNRAQAAVIHLRNSLGPDGAAGQ